MSRKLEGKVCARATRAKRAEKHPQVALDGPETENVMYFLRALDQIALALHAFGYASEGQSLSQVKFDLQNRIFCSAEHPTNPEPPNNVQKCMH